MFGDYQYIDNNETLEEGPTGSGVGVHAGGVLRLVVWLQGHKILLARVLLV